MVAVVGLSITLLAWRQLHSREQMVRISNFRTEAEERIAVIEAELEDQVQALHAVAAFYASSIEVQREEFATFGGYLRQREPAILALEWLPQIRSEDRRSFEEKLGKETEHASGIQERDEQGNMVSARPRPVYFPVQYVTPRNDNLAALGFDRASGAESRQAIEHARDTGQAVAFRARNIHRLPGQQEAVLLFMPIYHNHTSTASAADRRANLQGCVALVFRVGDVVSSVPDRLQTHLMDIHVLDHDASDEDWKLLYTTWPDPRASATSVSEAEYRHGRVLAFAGTQWTLLCTAHKDSPTYSTAWTPWIFLCLGTLMVLLASAYVLMLVGRTREVEDAVKQRTAELRASEDRLRRTVKDLRRATRELARSNRELEQFASIASHDLQEPLRKVQGFGDLLVCQYRDVLGDEGQDYLQRMQNAALRMRNLIDDLLTYSRVTTKARPFKQVALNEIVTQVLADLEIRIRETHGRVEVAVLPVLDADPLQMRQLFQNLIGNALKFHQKEVPPRVKISMQSREADDEDSSHESSESCTILIEDNGIGFDEKYLDEIFVLFKRLHGRSEYEGSGIGLAICRKIVQRHGGTITARSVVGQGTRFMIRLPLHQPAGGTQE